MTGLSLEQPLLQSPFVTMEMVCVYFFTVEFLSLSLSLSSVIYVSPLASSTNELQATERMGDMPICVQVSGTFEREFDLELTLHDGTARGKAPVTFSLSLSLTTPLSPPPPLSPPSLSPPLTLQLESTSLTFQASTLYLPLSTALMFPSMTTTSMTLKALFSLQSSPPLTLLSDSTPELSLYT